ncbi:MAG: lytic transglycosylase domain-containing protein [Candidatus Sulfotelmatobacter sp.]
MGRVSSFRLSGAVIAILAAMALPCFASDVAVLKNGFSIRHERREVVGDITRLYVNADGSNYVDVPTTEIEHFEAAPELPASSGRQAFGINPTSPPRIGNLSDPKGGFPGRPQTDLADVVNEASGRYRLDPDLVNSVIQAESGFHVRAVSPKGAQGLMQLMPGTASQLGVLNVFDAQANVEGGTKYLRELLERYNFDLVKALAAYNAGPQRVEQFGGVPPFYETRAYVARVVKDFNKKKVAQKTASAPSQRTALGNATGAGTASKSHNSGSASRTKASAARPSE